MKRTLRNLLFGAVLALNGCGETTLSRITPEPKDNPKVCDDFQEPENTSPPQIIYACQTGERKIEYRAPSCTPSLGFMVEEREQFCTEGVWGEFSDWYVTMACPDIPVPPTPECLDGQVELGWRTISCGTNTTGVRVRERTRECFDGHWQSWTPFTDATDCYERDRCVNGNTINLPDFCGINGNGLLTQVCIDGVYETLSCLDPAECLNGTTINVACGITGEGTSTVICEEGYLTVGPCSVPEIGDIDCIDTAPRREVRDLTCGLNERGTYFQEKTKECRGNHLTAWSSWSDISECIDPDDCVDGSTGTDTTAYCGINGTGFVTQVCEVGAWVNDGCDDNALCRNTEIGYELNSIPCGINNNGTQLQTREQLCADGQFGDFGDWENYGGCIDDDECVRGIRRAISCGINGEGLQIEVCNAEGRYEIGGPCLDTDVCSNIASYDAVSCGINDEGIMTATCTLGTLIYSPCDGDAVCIDGTLVDYELRSILCEINGIQFQERTQNCVAGNPGTWSSWTNTGSCIVPEVCPNERTVSLPCGINGEGTIAVSCEEGTPVYAGECTATDVCLNEVITTVSCGYNARGTTTTSCTDGQLAVGVCDDLDICTIGTFDYFPDSCGLNGRGTLEEMCVDTRSAETSLSDDDAVLGANDASVTIVEFGGYQDPFSARFFGETLPLIKANYIETGKAKFIFRDFPLSLHSYAQKAAEAAECAGEQGKYWEMHDKLFISGVGVGVVSFKSYASDLGLDTTTFNTCLDSGSMASEVDNDYADGLAEGVGGTPSFFINSRLIIGAQPSSVFETAIEEALREEGGENWTAWELVSCNDTDVCVDGTIDNICCGYEGEGTKSRTCTVGQWGEYGDCSASSLINASNNASKAEYTPAISEDNLVFIQELYSSYETTYNGDAFFKNVNELETIAECVSCNLPKPDAIPVDCGFCVCEWGSSESDSRMSNLSTETKISDIDGDQLVIEMTWRDYACINESFDGLIYVVDLTNNSAQARERGYHPHISNNQVVYSTTLQSIGNIKVFDSTTGIQIRDFGTGQGPPDISGNSIVFERTNTGQVRIYKGDITTGATTLISGTGATHDGYQPSIESNDVVFYSERDGNKQLYHYDTAAETLQRLTNCNNNYEPSVSQGKVAFTSERDGNKEVYTCDLAAAAASSSTDYCCANATNISNSPSADYTPSISGCKVAFTSERDGNKEVYVYDLCEGGCGEK